MPVIGEELRALLGMIPVRDRAGIARGNLAQETLANEANAEGQALLQQVGARPGMGPSMPNPGAMPRPAPPPLAIPPGMGTGRPGPADPETTGSIEPPTPTSTTTVTAPPAGAAAQYDDQMARRAKMAGFNDIVSSLGLIINGAANRGPSQGSTRDTLLAQLGSGGQSVHDVTEIAKTRQELLAADQKQLARKQFIDYMQRANGMSADAASAAWEAGESGKYMNPDAIDKREKDRQSAGARARILADPKLIKEMADNAGISPEMVTEHLKGGGSLDPKALADIAQTRGVTAKTAVDAAKAGVETREKIVNLAGIEEAQSKPAAVAERYRQMGYTWVTEDTVKSAAANNTTWTKFNENHQPLSTETQKDLAVENRMRKAQEKPDLTPSEFKQQGQRPILKTPQEEVEGRVLDRYTTAAEAAQKKALAAKNFIEVDNEVLQRHMNASPKLLLGPFSEKKLETRAFIADLFNLTDQAVNDTKAFKAQLKEYGLKVNEAFKGNFSDKDQRTVDAIVGGDYNEETLRDLIELREKHQRLNWQASQRELEQYHAHPKHGEFLKSFAPSVEMPRMGTFMQNKFDTVGGEAAAIPKLQAVRNNPRALDKFDKEWGAGLSRELLRKADALAATTDKEGR